MSIGSAAAASIGGTWDVFDRVNGMIADQVKRLNSLDEEDADSLIEFSMIAGEISEDGGREEMLKELERAKEMSDEICLICQNVEAALPD